MACKSSEETRHQFGRLEARHRKLAEFRSTQFVGQVFQEELFLAMVTIALKEVRRYRGCDMEIDPGATHERVTQALMPWYGKTLDGAALDAVFWRVIGGAEALAYGDQLAYDFSTCTDVWAPVLIREVRLGPVNRRGKQTLDFTFLVIAGRWAGLQFDQTISYKYAVYKLGHVIGFPRYEKRHYRLLQNMMFAARLVYVERKESAAVAEFEAPSTAISRNNRLRRTRKKPCPRIASWICEKCTNGLYGVGQCPRATHLNPYERAPCGVCGEERWFDNDRSRHECISCCEKRMRRRE